MIGLKIKEIRRMTEEEANKEGWEIKSAIATIIVLEDGTKIYASRDDEGNDIGTLYGIDNSGEGFYVTPEEVL